MDLVLTLLVSTAECERGFNTMKQSKSDWRSNLGVEMLNDLMIVQLVSPDIKEFNPHNAIDQRSHQPVNLRCLSQWT